MSAGYLTPHRVMRIRSEPPLSVQRRRRDLTRIDNVRKDINSTGNPMFYSIGAIREAPASVQQDIGDMAKCDSGVVQFTGWPFSKEEQDEEAALVAENVKLNQQIQELLKEGSYLEEKAKLEQEIADLNLRLAELTKVSTEERQREA